jgi:hypothetical protein
MDVLHVTATPLECQQRFKEFHEDGIVARIVPPPAGCST